MNKFELWGTIENVLTKQTQTGKEFLEIVFLLDVTKQKRAQVSVWDAGLINAVPQFMGAFCKITGRINAYTSTKTMPHRHYTNLVAFDICPATQQSVPAQPAPPVQQSAPQPVQQPLPLPAEACYA